MRNATHVRPRRLLLPALLALLVAGTGAFRVVPPDNAALRRIVQGVQGFYAAALPEKAFLHLDKAWYTAGETIWFSAYVVDATRHLPDTLSRVLHVELLNGQNQLVARRTLHLVGGLAPGDLALPDTLSPGHYTLRAYTNWMRNGGAAFLYARRLAIWPGAAVDAPDAKPAAVRARAAAARTAAAAVALPPDVQFFPEGGNLVAGLENVVAFKATDYAAHGPEVQGQVLDARNQPVATLGSSHLGMGSFAFTPGAGQRYHAVLAVGGRSLTVPLPAVQPAGYTLHVVTLANEFLVGIRQQGGPGGPVLLLGQVRGTVAYIGQGQLSGTETFAARIPKSKFAGGIVHFTLFDGQGQPLAERLAFAQPAAGLRVALTPDRASYGPRQPVRVRVAVTDAAGQPVAAHLSLAVGDALTASPGAETIASNLLLTSDLTGYVETPGYYFQNPTPETGQRLDALLLTQGWRRFAWRAVLAGQVPEREFGIERTLGIRGQVTQPNGKPVAASKLTLLETAPVKQLLTTATDQEGRFLFNGLGGCDTTRLTLDARSARDRHNVVIRLDAGPPVPTRPLVPLPLQAPPALAPALLRSQEQRATERKFRLDTTKTILLGGVTVKGAKTTVVDPRRPYQQSNAAVLNMADYPNRDGRTVLEMLQGRVPGVSITGTDNAPQVLIRGVTSLSGNSEPLFLLDGVPVTISVISNYPASDVETIEVLKGGAAGIFGSRASNGVVAVYTRRSSPTYNRAKEAAPGVAALRLPGYYCGRAFYVPRYDAPQTNRDYPDARRATLYWNPAVRTDASGQAEVRFFTSDATGTFRLSTEGLSGQGQPVLGTASLRVE